MHRVRLVPHIQQDHVKIEGGVRGNEARCGKAAKIHSSVHLHHLLDLWLQLPSFLGKLGLHTGLRILLHSFQSEAMAICPPRLPAV